MKVVITTPKGTISKDLNKFNKNQITFGRSSSNDIQIDCDIVSHKHGAIVKKGDGHWYIIDNPESKNGLLSHGEKVSEHKLGYGSRIEIAANNTRVVMVFDHSDKRPEMPKTPVTQPVIIKNLPENKVEVINGGKAAADVEETVQAQISQDKLHGFISGNGIREVNAVVTNKKVVVDREDGLISKASGTETIDIKDITGVKILNNRPWFMLGVGCLLVLLGLVFLLISKASKEALPENAWAAVGAFFVRTPAVSLVSFGIIVLITVYFRFRKVIIIQYAGGDIKMRFKYIDYSEVEQFKDAILATKEYYNNLYGSKGILSKD